MCWPRQPLGGRSRAGAATRGLVCLQGTDLASPIPWPGTARQQCRAVCGFRPPPPLPAGDPMCNWAEPAGHTFPQNLVSHLPRCRHATHSAATLPLPVFSAPPCVASGNVEFGANPQFAPLPRKPHRCGPGWRCKATGLSLHAVVRPCPLPGGFHRARSLAVPYSGTCAHAQALFAAMGVMRGASTAPPPV